MKQLIAYCGLDCEKCDARIATINDDDKLREQTSLLWSKLNNAIITKEMINCLGCCIDGVKSPFCENICEIRKCAISKKYSSCGECKEVDNCEKVAAIISNNLEAYNNLKTDSNSVYK